MNPMPAYDGDGDGQAERGTHKKCDECGAMIDIKTLQGHYNTCTLQTDEEILNHKTYRQQIAEFKADGKCVNCGKFHPCDCEVYTGGED